MKKITFTNTTVTKKPYVTINDMEYFAPLSSPKPKHKI